MRYSHSRGTCAPARVAAFGNSSRALASLQQLWESHLWFSLQSSSISVLCVAATAAASPPSCTRRSASVLALQFQEQYVKVTKQRGRMLYWWLQFRKDVEGWSAEMRDKTNLIFFFSLEVAADTDYRVKIFVGKGQRVGKGSLEERTQGLNG